ncbi:ceramide glucosyltransferase [Bartonella sp. LJL80]
MTLLATLLLWLAGICLALHLFTFAVVLLRSYWKPKSPLGDGHDQAVTILRPVSGLENNLERTLASGFELDHPKYEIIFCVSKDSDPVIPLVEKLMARYPDIEASLLIGNDVISDNPKLNNLVKGWKAAKYPWIVMTDSNVLMPKNYLAELFSRWTKHTGLVASPPLGSEPDNLPADLEAAFLNSYQARWQLTSDTIGNGFAQGKTLFWYRDILNKAGGIEALACELAEDAASTKVIRDQGLKVRLSAMPFGQPLGKKDWKSVWKRQVRWAKLRRDSFPAFFYMEILSGAVFPAICLFFACLLGAASFSLMLWYFIIWYLTEFLVTSVVGWPFSFRQAVAQIMRDLALPLLWLSAFTKGGYQWQGHKVDIGKK